MTLDEAIIYAEEVAKEQDKLCKRYDDASGYSRSHNEDIRTTDAKRCAECAKDHRQLAEWLTDYKQLLEQTSWIPVSERLPEKNGYYLTTTMYHEVYRDYWRESRFERTETVIAWMPLPEPYKAERNKSNLPNGYTFEDIEAAEPEMRKTMEACKLQL